MEIVVGGTAKKPKTERILCMRNTAKIYPFFMMLSRSENYTYIGRNGDPKRIKKSDDDFISAGFVDVVTIFARMQFAEL